MEATARVDHRAPRTVAAAGRKFRLLVISSDPYPPTRVDVSVLFGEELAGRGHHIDLILQSDAHCTRSFVTDWSGGRVWVAAADQRPALLHRLRKHISGIWNDARMFSLLKGDRYDAVEVKDKFLSGVLALLAARWHGKRFIYWLSFPFPEEYLRLAEDGASRYPLLYRIRGTIFSFLLYRVLLPRADHVFVQSEQMRREIAAKGLAPQNMTAVPMGVKVTKADTAEMAAIEVVRTVIPAGERSFLYLGTMARSRRIDFILRVLAEVLTQMPEAKLYLVGKADDPADDEFLRTEAVRLGVQASVVFVGQLPQAQALRYVRETDVCVSPLPPNGSFFSSMSPTKLVEYMAMGKAVVGNAQPEQQELINASNCGYCVPYEEKAFANAIVELLRTPEQARAMGMQGRRYALKHRAYGMIADVVERQMLKTLGGTAP